MTVTTNNVNNYFYLTSISAESKSRHPCKKLLNDFVSSHNIN